MMKKIAMFFMMMLLIVSSSVFAKQMITLDQKTTFDAVKWRITPQIGGIGFVNQTSKVQFIQVVLTSGSVGAYKISNSNVSIGCQTDLKANSNQTSMICELAPNDRFAIDLDMATMRDATGTYQVQMSS